MKTSLNTVYDLLYGVIQVLDKEKISAQTEDERDQKYKAAMLKKKDALLKALGAPGNLDSLEEYVSQNTAQETLLSIIFDKNVDCQNEIASMDFAAEFKRMNDEYQFFDNYAEVEESFIKAFKVCHYFNLLENSQVDETAERAYKMCAIFHKKGTNILANVDNFMKTSSTGFQNPVHDTFVFNFPKYKDENGNINFDLEQWRDGIQNLGIAALSKFALATDLHNIGIDKLPDTVAEFDAMLSKLSYKNHSQNQEIANIFGSYRIPDATFDTTLSLIEKGEIKMHGVRDNMPDALINVGALDSAKKGTYLMKIPKGNPRVLILGHITGCCQSIDGDAKKCAKDAMNLENNTCYALVKVKPGRSKSPTSTASSAALQSSSSSASSAITSNDKLIDWDTLFEKDGHKLVGQFYAWKSDLGNFCIDSSELSDGLLSNETFKKMMVAFAEDIMKNDPSIERVTIGAGGRTPEGLFPVSNYSESMKEGYMYGDAQKQYEIAVSPRLQALRDKLAAKTGLSNQTSIVSAEQAEYILNMDTAELDVLKKDYKILTLPYFYKNAQEVLNSKNYEAITSANARSLYLIGSYTFYDLQGFDAEKIQALTSEGAKECYKGKYYTLQELKEFDVEKIEAMVSWRARECYKGKYCTMQDLKEFDAEKIKALTSIEAKVCYKEGYCTMQDLKDFDADKIRALTGANANAGYKQKYCTLQDLKNFDADKINALTWAGAKLCYKQKYCTLQDLKNFDADKIKALTSRVAIECYKQEYFTLQDIKEFDAEKINTLTDVSTSFRMCKLDWRSLKAFDTSKIKALTNTKVGALMSKDPTTFEQLKNLNAEEILAKVEELSKATKPNVHSH